MPVFIIQERVRYLYCGVEATDNEANAVKQYERFTTKEPNADFRLIRRTEAGTEVLRVSR